MAAGFLWPHCEVVMGDRSALEQHPELAQLWTLHYAGRMALKSLEHLSTVRAPLLVQPAVNELRESISRLLSAVERYKDVVQIQRTEEVRLYIPESWSAEQADAAMELLGDLADRVWRAQQAERAKPRSG
jgi:hypothetical protein